MQSFRGKTVTAAAAAAFVFGLAACDADGAIDPDAPADDIGDLDEGDMGDLDDDAIDG